MKAGPLFFLLFVGALILNNVSGFKPSNGAGHDKLTQTVLRNLDFCPDAVSEITDFNIGVDQGSQFMLPRAHCDDENIQECHQRVIQLAERCISETKLAASVDGNKLRVNSSLHRRNAREALGEALHTLQDFYAHSNWINLNSQVHPLFSGLTAGEVPNVAGPGNATCEDNDGGALLNTSFLTSGYFGMSLSLSCPAPKGKCNHGSTLCKGINKDDSTRSGYEMAFERASNATQIFVSNILGNLSDIEKAQLQGDENCGLELAFVIDTTSTMYASIASVKQALQNMAPRLTYVSNFILVTFNDPECGNASYYNTSWEFIAALDALTMSGGGDCSERMMCGCLSAIKQITTQNAAVFVISDSSAKDSYLKGEIILLANALSIQVNFILSGTCTPQSQNQTLSSTPSHALLGWETLQKLNRFKIAAADPAQELYVSATRDATQQIAAVTGGSVMMVTPQDITGNLMFLLENLALAGQATLFSSTGSLNGSMTQLNTTADACRMIPFAVDPSMSNFTAQVAYPSLNLVSLLAPNGTAVPADVAVNGSTIWAIDTPTPSNNTWTVKICPALNNLTTFYAMATATSPYGINNVVFGTTPNPVQFLLGRQIDFVVIPGNVVVGESYYDMIVHFRGDPSTVQAVSAAYVAANNATQKLSSDFPLIFQARDENGYDSLLALPQSDSTPKIPSQPFLVQLDVTVAGGKQILPNNTHLQRQFSSIFHPSTITVYYVMPTAYAQVARAGNTTMVFFVSNKDSDSKNISLYWTVSPSNVLKIYPPAASIELKAGETHNISLMVERNPSSAANDTATVGVVAIDNDHPLILNQASVIAYFVSPSCLDSNGYICHGVGACINETCQCGTGFLGKLCETSAAGLTTAPSFYILNFLLLVIVLLHFA